MHSQWTIEHLTRKITRCNLRRSSSNDNFPSRVIPVLILNLIFVNFVLSVSSSTNHNQLLFVLRFTFNQWYTLLLTHRVDIFPYYLETGFIKNYCETRPRRQGYISCLRN